MLLYSQETQEWQQAYKKGEIPQEWLEDTCGETLALLNGDAEKAFFIALWIVCLIVFGVIYYV